MPRRLRTLPATLALVGAVVLVPSPALDPPVVFTVDSTGDDPDASPDGVCATSGGDCTLRAAIEEANAELSEGADEIHFDIPDAVDLPPHTIQPASGLPTVSDPVIIDGTTEPDFSGSPVVELDGTGAGIAHGVVISAGSSSVRGLVINRFSGAGIRIQGGTGNTIEGNYIGTDVNGTADLGNTQSGVAIDNSDDHVIGGATPAARNVISGNDDNGVVFSPTGASGNVVQGNYIGTDATGTADLGNSAHGVSIVFASSTTVGGTAPGSGNVVSGNGSVGVAIIGMNATGNQVLGNHIGTDAAGTTAIANSADGVRMDSAPNNTIGGTTAAARNVISGNGAAGVHLLATGSTGNVVQGNYIGTDGSGMAALGNGTSGVRLNAAPNNTIGGTDPGARNVISGNLQGMVLSGSSTTGNVVLGNYVGTDAAGTGDLGNTFTGVSISNSPGNTIGGTDPGAGNVVSGNGSVGIHLNLADATGNIVQGNYVGTDASGTGALGNSLEGVSIIDAPGNTIGGTDPGAGNLISGNSRFGVLLTLAGTTGNIFQGNLIGTDVSGTADLGNALDGVRISLSAADNLIGGTAPGAGNVVAFNGAVGLGVDSSGPPTGNSILGNSMHSNSNLGIDLDLDGVTPNDVGPPHDTDPGANNLQNFPEVSWAVSGSAFVAGTLASDPATSYRIEFFSSPSVDPSGFGEGQTFLGATTVTTDGNGDAGFLKALAAEVPDGSFMTTTATRLDGGGNPTDTSEFSEAEQVPTACTQTGTAGPDVLAGTPDDDVLCGFGGNDVFLSSPGNDVYVGGAGKDTAKYTAAAGPVDVNLVKKVAADDGDGGADALLGVENVVGSPGADVIKGDGKANRLKGGGGNDLLVGRGANDVLIGGSGKDVERGGVGKDRLSGGSGADTQLGQGGGDRLVGGAGGDTQKGGGGNDVILGRGGNDSIDGGAGRRDRCRQGTGSGPVVNCEV